MGAETTAIIAGRGALPGLLACRLATAGGSATIAALEGVSLDLPADAPVLRFRLERLAGFLEELRAARVGRVILAGGVRRPQIDPAAADPRSAALLARLLPALGAGDDATLRAVVALFEAEGFEVAGVEAVCPELLPAAGHIAGPAPTGADLADAARAAAIVARLGAADIGQAAVVAQGLCLAVETLPGTDAMLDWVGRVAAPLRPDPAGARGVLFKAPKPGQEMRADRPAIGPETVARTAAAGLGGIAVAAGGVLLLGREATLAAAAEAGIALWAVAT